MKYRIKQVDNEFYPQYKRFLIWWDFENFCLFNGSISFNSDSLCYDNLTFAKSFISYQIQCKHKRTKMVVSKCGDVFYFNTDLKSESKYPVFSNEYLLDKELEKINHKPKIVYHKYESSN